MSVRFVFRWLYGLFLGAMVLLVIAAILAVISVTMNDAQKLPPWLGKSIAVDVGGIPATYKVERIDGSNFYGSLTIHPPEGVDISILNVDLQRKTVTVKVQYLRGELKGTQRLLVYQTFRKEIEPNTRVWLNIEVEQFGISPP